MRTNGDLYSLHFIFASLKPLAFRNQTEVTIFNTRPPFRQMSCSCCNRDLVCHSAFVTGECSQWTSPLLASVAPHLPHLIIYSAHHLYHTSAPHRVLHPSISTPRPLPHLRGSTRLAAESRILCSVTYLHLQHALSALPRTLNL